MHKKISYIIAITSIAFVCQNCSRAADNKSSSTTDAKLESNNNENVEKSSFANTPNFRRALIEDELKDYYDLYLQREPDEAGLQFWADHVFDKNLTMAQAKGYIKNSEEAQNVGPRPDYQHIPNPNLKHTTCTLRVNGQERTLSSRVGYITQYRVFSSTYYPGKARYKESSQFYCTKQRVRCWAGQVRARVVNIEPTHRYIRCDENSFREQPETSYQYARKLYQDLKEIYESCEGREPNRQEVDQSLTQILQRNGSLYDIAAQVCSW